MTQSVVVIGNFDGVHPGHREVLREAKRAEPGLPLIVITFWPHPMAVVRPDRAPKLLTRLEERVELLKEAGADEVRVIDFTPEFASMAPERFLRDVIEPLDPARVVVGENFRFGHRAQGTVDTLREFGRGRFAVTALPLVGIGDQETCSTTIRDALASGDVRQAAEYLGRPFRFSGVVTPGDRRGRELGYPTANVPVPDELACPSDGVYAGWLTRVDGRDALGEETDAAAQAWPAAISVGTNPTFDGVERRVESYVLDRTDLELYGARVAVDFIERIRGQVRFDSIEALVEQMKHDVARCRVLLAGD
ncbi:bifunctional riboflavin kinase/FAD synthetase [Nigerium massiliense]|uniref:bifunctional riboflavin kinase/FAD synthetase n=1 Tax=Nigerium massiliense TaxID=1522317 RepID=UPI0005905707|nr:bifunctional riboflavin kinase/FAD synthetase [Nigerium massiliense]